MGKQESINLFFHVTRIPDLSLNKYSSGENNGVSGMLDKHAAFLRQWNRKGVLSGVSLHLYYVYSPEKPQGDRLDIYVLARGNSDEMKNAVRIMGASPFSDDYGFTLLSDKDIPALYEYLSGGQQSDLEDDAIMKRIKSMTSFAVESRADNPELFEREYNKCVILSKRELFIKPSTAVTENDETFYTFSNWEMNEEARLYQMLSMMKTLNISFQIQPNMRLVEC